MDNKNDVRKFFKLKPGDSPPASGVAPTKRIEQYNDIMNKFMEKIFRQSAYDFFLLDETIVFEKQGVGMIWQFTLLGLTLSFL